MRTIGDIITEVRGILQDRDMSSLRYSDEDLYAAFNSSLDELKRLRPDAFFGSAYDPAVIYSVSDAGTVLPVSPQFFTPMVYFIAGYAELRDDQFTVDGRAAILLSKYGENLTEPGKS